MDTTAVKHDEGKPRIDLIPPQPLLEIGNCLAKGAIKYPDRNWEKGLKWSRVYAALMRHLFKWWKGEKNDPEDGISHLTHAATDILFLMEYQYTHQDYDDRPFTKVIDDITSKIKGLKHCGLNSVDDKKTDEPLTLLDIVARVLHGNREEIMNMSCPCDYDPTGSGKTIFSKPFPEDTACPKLAHRATGGVSCYLCWHRAYNEGKVEC